MFGCDIFEALVTAGRVRDSESAGKMCSGWPFTIKGECLRTPVSRAS